MIEQQGGKRRAKGSGSIRPLGPGRWEVMFDVAPGPDGKRRRRSITVHGTKSEAQKELTRRQHELDSGLAIEPPEKQTVGTFLAQWLRDSAAARVAPKTLEEYQTCVTRHLTPALGKTPLARLRPEQIQALYAAKLQTLSSSRVRHIHAVLHRALEQAVRWGYVARNVADAVEPPVPGKPRVETYDAEQVAELLSRAQGSAVYLGAALAIHTGMRLGEILALRWEDVDLDTGSLRVRRSFSQTGTKITVKTPKNGRGRVVAVGQEVLEILRRHKGEQAARRLRLAEVWEDHGLIYPNEDGTPRKPDTFSKTFREFIVRSGLPKITFHGLRHTHATLLMGANVHPEIVSERLGHSNIGITLNTYSHVTPGMDREAAETFGRLMRKAGHG
jgi:integrase